MYFPGGVLFVFFKSGANKSQPQIASTEHMHLLSHFSKLMKISLLSIFGRKAVVSCINREIVSHLHTSLKVCHCHHLPLRSPIGQSRPLSYKLSSSFRLLDVIDRNYNSIHLHQNKKDILTTSSFGRLV